jgi:hypothetical protein
MIVYISGPMTGLTNFNRDSFALAEAYLKRDGHEVRNPACLPDGWTYDHYMEIDLAMLKQCDAIVSLPGAPSSPGAKVELAQAEKDGLKAIVWSEPEWKDLYLKYLANGGPL